MEKNTLDMLRQQIDQVDSEILRLFEKRLDISKEVASYKRENNLPILHEKREQQVLDQITDAAAEEYRKGAKVLFSNLMDISKSLQQKAFIQKTDLYRAIEKAKQTDSSADKSPVIACQGVEGAYSHIACEKLFPSGKAEFYKNFEDVFEAVQNSEVDYGLLPLDNSTAGSVGEVYELMKSYNFYINRSITIQVQHCLAAKPGINLGDLKAVYSHRQALDQCSLYLKKNAIQSNTFINTAAAAQYVAKNDAALGAICSVKSAELYGLSILEKNIANSNENYTRFICISREMQLDECADTVAVSFTIPNAAGSLYRFLTRFYVAGVDLTKIESKPLHTKNFDVMFYLDFKGNVYDENILILLNELYQTAVEFKFLGNFCVVE